jgi:hypothetical protein
MARRKKPNGKALKPTERIIMGRRFDLGTVEGSKASTRFIERRKKEALEALRLDLEDIRHHVDTIDKAIISVLTDLAGVNGMTDTAAEMALIAEASFCIRGHLPEKEATVQS